MVLCWPGRHPGGGRCPSPVLLAGLLSLTRVVVESNISLLLCSCDVFSWQVPKLSSAPAIETTVGGADSV